MLSNSDNLCLQPNAQLKKVSADMTAPIFMHQGSDMMATLAFWVWHLITSHSHSHLRSIMQLRLIVA